MKSSLKNIGRWVSRAFNKLADLIKAGKTDDAAAMMVEVRNVVVAYIDTLADFMPEKSVSAPNPRKPLTYLSWIGKNLPWINLIVALTSGNNPLQPANDLAKACAQKWGFYWEDPK